MLTTPKRISKVRRAPKRIYEMHRSPKCISKMHMVRNLVKLKYIIHLPNPTNVTVAYACMVNLSYLSTYLNHYKCS